MATDYAPMIEGLQAAIPFNNHLGLRYVELGPGKGVVVLPEGQHLNNHVGSQHAAGLFAAGEAASGGAFMTAFEDLIGTIMPLAEKADIAYKKLALGPITATGTFSADRAVIEKALESEGRARFPVEVELHDASGTLVAEMTVHWYVKKLG